LDLRIPLQNAGRKAEEISFVVCDVNSEKESLQVNFSTGEHFFVCTTKNGQNWLYAKRPKQTKTSNNAQIHSFNTQANILLPL